MNANRRRDPKPESNAAPGPGAQRFALPRLTPAALADQHLYSALSSLGRLWQRRGATALTVLVMALALALPLLLELAVRNLQRFGGALEDSRELSAFLEPGIAERAAKSLRERALVLPDVAAVEWRAPEQGLEELRALAGFGEALELLRENPLPGVLLVTPREDAPPEAVRTLAGALDALEGVDFVQFDLAWRERLTRALALAARAVIVLGVLLGFGALLVVGNTIRLDVAGRADEIAIVQLLGGSDGFVRRPFLYAGVWYGLLAVLVALLGVFTAQLALAQPVAALAQTYGSEYRLEGLSWRTIGATVLAGIVLGWLGAWSACGRHLASGRPG